MGICHAGDDYGRRFSDIFGHIPNTARCMEDLVIYSRTYEEHVDLLRILFKTANDNNVSFNKKKNGLRQHNSYFRWLRNLSGRIPAQPGTYTSHPGIPPAVQRHRPA